MIQPAGTGSRIEVRFYSIWWIELIVRLMGLIFVGPIAAYGIALLLHAGRGGTIDWGPVLIWACAPLLTALSVVVIEVVARWMGDRDEDRMRAALREWFPR